MNKIVLTNIFFMNKDYNFIDLLSHWEEDLISNDIIEDLEMVKPSNRLISKILSYANITLEFSTTLNSNIELCLN